MEIASGSRLEYRGRGSGILWLMAISTSEAIGMIAVDQIFFIDDKR